MSSSLSMLRRLLIIAGGLLVVASVGAAIVASLDFSATSELEEERKLGLRQEVEAFEREQAAILARARESAGAGRMEEAAKLLAESGSPDRELAAQVGDALLEAAERARRDWDEGEARRFLELAKRVFKEENGTKVLETELLVEETERLVWQSKELLEAAGDAIAEGKLAEAEMALVALESGGFPPEAGAKAAELRKTIVSEREDRDRDAVRKNLARLLDEGRVTAARQLMERHALLTGNDEYRTRITALTELEQAGGTESYLPVRDALRFIVKCQAKTGGFTLEQYLTVFPKDQAGGKWSASYDVGISGLCLMAFTAFRHIDVAGEFDQRAANCARYLASTVSRAGTVAGTHYNHAIVALALLERVRALGQDATKAEFAAAARIINYLTLSAQLPDGGWRYTDRGTSDSSVTCWVLQAVHAAKRVGIAVHDDVISKGLAYLDTMTDAEGWTGYVQPGRVPNLTAATLLVRQLFPEQSREGAAEQARKLLLDFLAKPLLTNRKSTAAGTAITELKKLWHNHYGWYYATYAFHLEGGSAWAAWGPLLANTLGVDQERLGELAGSFPPDPYWGKRAGRLYTTALAALTLEVYYR